MTFIAEAMVEARESRQKNLIIIKAIAGRPFVEVEMESGVELKDLNEIGCS